MEYITKIEIPFTSKDRKEAQEVFEWMIKQAKHYIIDSNRKNEIYAELKEEL